MPHSNNPFVKTRSVGMSTSTPQQLEAFAKRMVEDAKANQPRFSLNEILKDSPVESPSLDDFSDSLKGIFKDADPSTLKVHAYCPHTNGIIEMGSCEKCLTNE